MKRYKGYSEYKDSGVEWIGEIPGHWIEVPLKHIVFENLNSLGSNTEPNYELDYIEISDIDSNGIIGNPTHYIFSESPSRCRRIVKKNDILLSTVRTYLKAIGIIEKDVQDLICSTGFSVLTPKEEIEPKFVFYMLRSEYFISEVISNSVGVSYPAIQSEKLMSIISLLPPLPEQHQIVRFLDTKTALIDTLIEKTQRKIELLREKRTALINHTVTKGLNPNAKMKDSGVEWIGVVPEHWMISKLKYDTLSPVQYGINISSEKYTDEGIRFIRITDLTENGDLIEADGSIPPTNPIF